MGKDYYKILGIDKSVSQEEIKKAFRKLAIKYHPDKNQGNKQAEERFKEINEANDVLSDPEKRKKYDRFGENWQAYEQGAPGFGGFKGRPSQRTNEGGQGDYHEFFGGTDYSDIFENIFNTGGAQGGRNRRFKGQDIRAELEISFDEAYHGTSRAFTINNQTLNIKLKPGIADGQVLKLKGKGYAGINGGEPGDLFLEIKVKEHTSLVRKGDDLHKQITVSLYKAVLGGKVQVDIIENTIMVDIPAGTQNEKILRLKGKGMPKYNAPGTFGDFYISVRVDIPIKLSDKEKKLFEELASIRGEKF